MSCKFGLILNYMLQLRPLKVNRPLHTRISRLDYQVTKLLAPSLAAIELPLLLSPPSTHAVMASFCSLISPSRMSDISRGAR